MLRVERLSASSHSRSRLGVWAAGTMRRRRVEGMFEAHQSAEGMFMPDHGCQTPRMGAHPGVHPSRCMRFKFIAVHISRHSAPTAVIPRRLKDLNPSTCLIHPNTGSGMVLRRR